MKRTSLLTLAAAASCCLAAGIVLAEPPEATNEKPLAAPQAEPQLPKKSGSDNPQVLPAPRVIEYGLARPVEFDVKLLSVDWAKLRAKKIDLAKTLAEFGEAQELKDREHDRIIMRVLTSGAAGKLINLLKASNVVKIESAPKVRTLARQEAMIHSIVKRPIAVIRETVNGISRKRVETLPSGYTVRLTPHFLDGQRLQIRMSAESGRLELSGVAESPGVQPKPILRKRVLESMAEIESGQTIVLAERGPEGDVEGDDSEPGLMLVVTPTVCKPELVRPAVPRIPGFEFSAGQRLFPGIRLSDGDHPYSVTGFRGDKKDLSPDIRLPGGIHVSAGQSLTPDQLKKVGHALGAEPSIQPSDRGPTLVLRMAENPATPARLRNVVAESAHPAESSDGLHGAVRDLRSEVRELRQDVDRLIKLLEEREQTSTGDVSPRRGAGNNEELAELQVRYDELMNQGRYQDAERVGVEARELDSAIGSTWIWKARFARRTSLDRKAAGGVQPWSDLQRFANSGQSIQQKLDKTLSLNVENVPLKDVLVQLSKATGLNVVVDNLGLEEEGVRANVPVSLHVNDVPAKTALELLLEPLHLAYTIRDDEVVVITGKVRAQGPLTVVAYSVADLIAAPNTSEHTQHGALDLEGLGKLIMAAVEPDQWSHAGGVGNIQPMKTTLSLVIRQTRPTHERIANLLSGLRRLQDFQVEMKTLTVSTPEDFWDELSASEEAAPVFRRLAENGRYAVLNDDEAQFLRNQLNNEARTNLLFHKATQFNGWPARITSMLPVAGHSDIGNVKIAVSLRPTISLARRTVRLEFLADKLQTPIPDIPDGKTVLIDLTDETLANIAGVPIVNKVPDTSRVFKRVDSPKQRILFFVTPQIRVEEEEEELLGIPDK